MLAGACTGFGAGSRYRAETGIYQGTIAVKDQPVEVRFWGFALRLVGVGQQAGEREYCCARLPPKPPSLNCPLAAAGLPMAASTSPTLSYYICFQSVDGDVFGEYFHLYRVAGHYAKGPGEAIHLVDAVVAAAKECGVAWYGVVCNVRVADGA